MRHFDGTKKGQSAEYRRALRKACISNAFQYSTTSSLVRYRADLDMKRVISDTDGGHFTDRPQGRRNRRSRRAIAASINFGQNRSKTFIFKMPWTSTCPLHHIFRPSFQVPWTTLPTGLRAVGTRGNPLPEVFCRNRSKTFTFLFLPPLRFVDIPQALSYRQDHSCSRSH